jgi:2-hydroxychromene-2-carboxylate isomerase
VSAIRFYFDFLSPYAYLAWTQIHAIADRHGRAVEPVPVLLAAMLEHHGTKGPAEVPAKRRYVLHDVARKARALGVRSGVPRSHPFNPLLALRATSVPMDAAARRALVDRIYAAVWSGEARDVEDRATVAALATDAGLDGAHVVPQAESPEGKARLRTQTEAAVAEGVFGVPWMVVDGEPFWGVDSLSALEQFLTDGRPSVDAAMLASWLALRPTAERSGRPRQQSGR